MTSDGECEACGTLLVVYTYLTKDGIEAAVICPNCDQIRTPEDVIRPDARDDAPDD